MFRTNRRHLKKVLYGGGGLTALLAAASLVRFSPLVAASILIGGAIGIINIYSIVRVVEALAGAAAAGAAPGRATKVFSVLIHLFKLALIFACLLALALMKKVNLFGVLAGFTAVLAVNLLAGLSGLNDQEQL